MQSAAPGPARSRPPKALELGLIDELVATPRGPDPGRQDVDRRRNPRGGSAVGRQGLQDPRRHAVDAVAGGRTCRRSRPTCASSSRAPTTPRRTTSCPPPSRAPRSTSTPRWRSRAATSSTWSPARSSKNMIQAFFFDLSEVNGNARPPDDDRDVHADQGGRARRGHDGRRDRLRLRQGRASRSSSRTSRRRPPRRARATPRSCVDKAVEQGPLDARRRPTRCWPGSRPTADAADAQGARSRDRGGLRGSRRSRPQVFAEIEPYLADGALLGSNTSTLPITGLAGGRLPTGGLHRAALLQPRGQDAAARDHQGRADVSEETLYRALDVAKQIKKTPIVVNDSRGFFTSRVIGTFINEGIAMLLEGIPARVDRAGLLAGRLSGAGAAALRRAELQAHAQDPQGDTGGGRGRGRKRGQPHPADDRDRPDARRVRPRRPPRAAQASTSTRTASAPVCGRA